MLAWLEDTLREWPTLRIVVSSRPDAFPGDKFGQLDFVTLRIEPLALPSIDAIIQLRIEDEAAATRLQAQCRAEYAELARNPLLLSLLIHILPERGDLTRSAIYSLALEQMLYRTDELKRARRGGAADQEVASDLRLLASKSARRLLSIAALRAHTRGTRDLDLEELCTEQTEAVLDALQRSVRRGHVPLFDGARLMHLSGQGGALLGDTFDVPSVGPRLHAFPPA